MSKAPEPTWLYRVYGDAGLLLYIGISEDFGRRWKQHARKQPWWDEMRRLSADHLYGSRPEAEAAELEAITAERPKYNIVYGTEKSRKARRELRAAPASGVRRAAGKRVDLNLSEEDLDYWEPLAMMGGFLRTDYLPVPDDGSPEMQRWAIDLYLAFTRACGRAVRQAWDLAALLRTAERVAGLPPELADRARKTRHEIYRQNRLPCPCCNGHPGAGMLCQECGADGTAAVAEVPPRKLPLAIVTAIPGRARRTAA